MKTKATILAFTFLLLFMIACSNETGITNPVQSADVINAELFKAPAKTQFGRYLFTAWSDQGSYSVKVSKDMTVDGTKGATVFSTYKWNYGKDRGKSFAAKLTIPAGAFESEKTFNMVFSLDDLSIEMLPHNTNFDIPLELTLIYSGVSVSELNLFSPDFYYLSGTGSPEPVIVSKVVTSEIGKFIYVQNAQLPHFSRYGFIR